MPAINPNDPRAPYTQIADDIRRSLGTAGRMPGDKLPSNRELAAMYDVASMTVHQAVRALRDEGLLVSFQGRGVFVADAASALLSGAPADTATQLQQLRSDLDETKQQLLDSLSGDEVSDLRDELEALKRHVGVLETQLMDLYSKTGQPYPRDGVTHRDGQAGSDTRRRASGS